MKAGLFAAALVQLAAAQPHRHAQHAHMHEKRVVTEVEVVTATASGVVVYVDAQGAPVSTHFAEPTVAPAAPSPEPQVSFSTHISLSLPIAKASTLAKVSSVKPSSVKPSPVKPTSVKASSIKASPSVAVKVNNENQKLKVASSSGSSNTGLGIAYDPYSQSGQCKSASQVAADFEKLDGYSMVRIYGTDCDQVANVYSAAKAKNMKMMVGVFELGSVASEVSTIISAMKNDWDMIDTVSIGNELVNSGSATASEVVAALSIARPLLKAAGFGGNIVTVDTFNAIIANPELCEASDYAAANAYAFFDPTSSAEEAGPWAVKTAQQVKDACGGKKVVITESGFSSCGQPNGSIVPSPANQKTAIASLRSSFPDGGLILFSAYNDLWKSPGAFGAEQCFGIYGNSAS